MPKLKQDIDRDYRWSIVAAWAVRNGYKGAQMAKIWGCAESTVSDIKKHPEKLNIGKLQKMKLDRDELYNLVYGR